MSPFSVDHLEIASDAVGRLVAGVGPGQWDAPTPCAEWTVRDLVTHLITVNRAFTAMLTGEEPPVPEDVVAAYRTSAAALRAAYDQPEHSMDGTPGATRLGWRISDLLTHAWDLSRATGQALELPDDLVRQALDFVRTQLAGRQREGRFGPEQPAPSDAHAIDQLSAFLGRTVS
ncbi:TIGR03086 family metal-binding protein [Nonomuraea sp. NPDC050691]|uniref:TIGR03086 family metal-binding protein n=1 Tax=Nonomuraea sp. NPDC050691 TaxID=3155661 RepID=UPI0033FF3958